MFTIEVRVEGGSLTGLLALDWRRARGLGDGVDIRWNASKRICSVDEAFARKHFRPTEISPFIIVGVDALTKDDVSFKPGTFATVVTINISDERAREIFAKARENAEVVHDLDFGHAYPKYRL